MSSLLEMMPVHAEVDNIGGEEEEEEKKKGGKSRLLFPLILKIKIELISQD